MIQQLVVVALIVVYAGGFWRFWSGFERTNFSRSLVNRLALSFLWPALFIANRSYRRNFRKALKG
ncbi:hypothetical protein [Calothrix rhizosoleniae]|uniref:hypothetical protein n=1 Tax=Calothrix rhizosoleniae TaxID=888997 RepID=UPI0038993F90